MSDADRERYEKAMHAVQTAVKYEHAMGSSDGSPKHLRVGINASMVNHQALASLCLARGLFTLDEYHKALADAAEAEVRLYETRYPRIKFH